MEVAIGGNGGTPFQREVREWQRVDPNTGALLTGRLEADRWVNGPLNAYGKVVDSQNVSQPNGTQHSQRKQFEVLQARTSSGSLQVVRAQTVQTSSSSSRWSSGIRTAHCLGGQNFNSGIQLLTNGHHSTNGNGHEEPSNDFNQYNQHEHHNQHTSSSSGSSNSSPLMATSSLKLSTLMKSSTTTNGDGKTSPHSISNSMSLVQRHQQHENETKSKFFDGRFQPTTVVDSRVGGILPSEQKSHQEPQSIMDILQSGDRKTSDSGVSFRHLHSRGKSVSTDDLATEWDQNDDDAESPSEWRRVSKIRRSFQFPKSTSPKPITQQRPVDLPENSVSVSRIRQELENGRRLNTAMRNNHVDLVALDNILNGSGLPGGTEHKTEAKPIKKATFLTAESLKEIRGKLRKLSDESLYKDDFITQNRNNMDNENNDDDQRSHDQDSSDDLHKIMRINEYSVQQPVVLQDSQIVQQQVFQHRDKPPESIVYTTNSLESRNKYRDTTSAEWHLRRKSYGFEKMTPPADSMFRLESSTDSGIGRSNELANWSPAENQPRGTVITFSDNLTPKTTFTIVNGQETNGTSSGSKSLLHHRRLFESGFESKEVKRHSIAVDESKYVRDNLKDVFDSKTSVHLNGLYQKESNSSQASMTDESSKRTKRVEFCKTEVHFAAESGRVNIVETDGKPPPTNNFRRRRRTSSSSIGSAYLEAINSGIPVTHFGDEQKPAFEQDSKDVEDNSISAVKINVTVSTPLTNTGADNLTKKSYQEEEDEQQFSEEISLRGILKNKPMKPKPYHLGENIDNSESLWGIRLKPVTSEYGIAKRLNHAGNPDEEDSESELTTSDIKDHSSAIKSVVERVRIVEQRKSATGFSTKINLNLSDSPYSWESPDIEHQLKLNKPIKLHLEESVVRNSVNESTSTLTSSSSSPSSVPIIRRGTRELEINNDDGLKSTSLIMKTMRSANQFDEAMKRLSLTENQIIDDHLSNNASTTTALKLISNMNAITKSNSANSIFQEQSRTVRTKYTSSLDGDFILDSNEDYKSSPKLHSYDRVNTSGDTQMRHMQVLTEEPQISEGSCNKKPVAAPRVRVIGSSNAINHQLSQLRRMYEAESDDSAKADEEVNLYLGGGLLPTTMTEEKVSELSGSWSRVKAKRSNQKNKLPKDEDKGLHKSNVMSIELYSPAGSLKKGATKARVSSPHNDLPFAKPRSISPVKLKRSSDDESTSINSKQIEILRKTDNRTETTTQSGKEPLKIVTGGARKLRDHELSYFGVKVTNSETKNASNNNNDNQRNNKETNRNQLTYNNNNNNTNNDDDNTNAQKWKLPSDKPDLLRHSPILNYKNDDNSHFWQPSENMQIEYNGKKDYNNDGPIYENLKKASLYNRKTDLQRDEMILTEMTKEADLSLKPVKNVKSGKSSSNRSPQKVTKPLDTIDEKKSSKSHSHHYQSHSQHAQVQQPSQQKSMKSRSIQVSHTANDNFQRPCRLNRPSSGSSNESLTRSSSNRHSNLTQGSRDTKEKLQHANVQSPTKKRSATIRECSKLHHRSSSHDSRRTNASSSEDLSTSHSTDHSTRRIRRIKSKEKGIAKGDHRQQLSRQAIVSSTTRASTESDDGPKLKSVSSSHSPSFSSKNDNAKISRRSGKSESTDQRSSASRSRTSSITTDVHKTRTKTAGIVTTTSQTSKHHSSRSHSRK